MTTPERLRELSEATEPRLQLVAPFFLFPGPEVTELLLVRHAQVPESSTIVDSALTPLGREQAEALAAYLASQRINAVYASPSDRAVATAAAIAEPHGLSVETVDGLRDIDNRMPHGLGPLEALQAEFGDAEGKRRFDAMVEGGWSLDLFGEMLESSAALRWRVAGAVDSIVARHRGRRVVAVSHGPPIAAYIGDLLSSPADFSFYPRLTSITVVLARGERRQLQLLNAMPHFGVL